MLPRSDGGLAILAASPPQDPYYTRSPSMSKYPQQQQLPEGALNRRSIGGTSEALQYYWSESAGERSSSFSSSLGKSPLNSTLPALGSPYSLNPQPLLHEARSNISLRELVEEEAAEERLRIRPDERDMSMSFEDGDPYTPRDRDRVSSAGPSNRRIHLVSYSSDSMSAMASEPSMPSSIRDMVPSSPSSSHSAESKYSLIEEDVTGSTAIAPVQVPRRENDNARRYEAHRHGVVDTDGHLGVLLDPSFEEWAHQRSWDQSTPTSPAIVSPQEVWRTPQPEVLERSQMSPMDWPARSPHDADVTPRNSSHIPRSTSRFDNKALSGGRLLFVASPDVSRRSIDDLQRDIAGLGLDGQKRGRIGLSVNSSAALQQAIDDADTPRSAPAHKTAFDDNDLGGDKGRVRPTSLLPPPTTPLETPTNVLEQQLNLRTNVGSASPAISSSRSPELPPKSELRRTTPTPPPPKVSTPEHHDTPPLPTIINTPHTPELPSRMETVPFPGSARSLATPRTRSNSPPDAFATSSTIQDLSKMLGGAIDEIGLVDSRDIPPPTLGEPAKGRPMMLHNPPPRSTSTQNVAQHEPQSLSPTGVAFPPAQHQRRGSHSSQNVGLGLVGGAIAATSRANVTRHVRKASSILSIRSNNTLGTSPSGPAFVPTGPQTLPAAVLFGNIKALHTSGDRARAYYRSIGELARADSGLQDLCAFLRGFLATTKLMPESTTRPVGRTKQGTMNYLGVGNLGPAMPSTLTLPSMRNVSSGSEFPMRPDAYTAREIAVRNLDPTDEPSALPPNLPFPQLQNQVKTSGSIQSLASVASNQRGGRFLSAFGRLKKDKENSSLGPPTGSLMKLNPVASASNRDLRSSTNSGSNGRSSLDSTDSRVQPTLPMPRGPRGPPEGTTGPRLSIETPRQFPVNSRASLDSQRSGLMGPRGPGASHVSLTASPLARQDSSKPPPNEEEVRQFSDLIPQAERAVVRAYLQRYGEMNYAMTAYLDDEKTGTLMRV